jgi:thiol-disulfide isomerase/thioredoxin
MRKLLFIAALLLSVVIVWSVSPPPPPTESALRAPDVAYTTLEGKSGKLSALQGKIVLVHFWATWCFPCIKEFPALIELAEGHPEKLHILAFSADDSLKILNRFLKDKNIPKNMEIIWDKDKTLSRDLFQTVNYPETILIGCNGQMEDKVVGVAEDWEATVKPLLAACTHTPSSL